MDPTNNPTLKQATEMIQAGDLERASILLAKHLKRYPENEHAWHILSYALIDSEKQIYSLERALLINPNNKFVRQRLDKLCSQKKPITARTQISDQHTKHPKMMAPKKPGAVTPTPPFVFGQTNSQQHKVQQAIQVQPPFIESPETAALFPISRLEPLSQPQFRIPTFEISQTTRPINPLKRLATRAMISWRGFRLSWRIFAQSPLAIIGLILIVLFGLMAIAHPILMNTVWNRGVYDPATGFDLNVFPHPSPPVPGHILGTDSLGRDVLSMILAATTPTFVVGLTAALTTAIIGTTFSVIAAYFRGTVDTIITNFADVFLLFPAPVIMVIIGARFRDLTPMQLGLIYGFVTGAGGTTIVMRSQAIQIASKPFMEAAHVAGGSPLHIISKHLIPSVLPLATLQMMIAVTGAVVADGFISFFGLTRSVSNWGTIIYDAFIYGNISGNYGPPWHMLIPSAACFSLFALGFYLVSRGLHRVASPIIREEY